MPSSSINIGINQQGKQLVDRIDLHFKNHERDFYKKYILSASMELKDGNQQLSTIKNRKFSVSNKNNIKAWFDFELYGEINTLRNAVSGLADGVISVNITLSVCDRDSTAQLKFLLDAIKELKENQQISNINVKLFVILYDVQSKGYTQDVPIQEELEFIESIAKEYDFIIRDIYYLDDRNEGRFLLNLSLDWLAFALSEFFVFQMIRATSGAAMNKSKVFGLGVIHFNEMLFRNVITNTILQYKFDQEGVLEKGGIQLRDIFNTCNPFVEEHQNFFLKFLDTYPFSQENHRALTANSETYVKEFDAELEQFITSTDNTIGESKTLLANLLGEDDKKLEGINWSGKRLNINDLEFDILNYFNKYLEEREQVKFHEQKELRGKITNLAQGIKKDKKKLKGLEEQSNEMHRDLDISFEEGVFSVDGKRINASGYIPSPISPSDEVYTCNDEAIPATIDLSGYFPSVKNQGKLDSCTAFVIAAVYEFFAKQNNKNVDISELFIYYNTRDLNANANVETGATLLDTIRSVKEKGACHSKSHPYEIDAFADQPTEEAYTEAQHQVVKKASRIKIKEKDFRQAIANGHPVIVGLKIFKSFYPKNKLGVIPFPSSHESSYEDHGNHALLIVGYNDEEKLFKLRNSWGKDFGDNGYCYAPYDYIANPEFCQEAFVISEILDLSFNEFNYDSNTSFSFLKDITIRRKVIREYNLRTKKRKLANVKIDYDNLALRNEENAERIKDPLFRKQLFDKLKEEADQTITVTNPKKNEAKANYTIPVLITLAGLFAVIISALLTSIITLYGTLAGVVIGIIVLVYGVIKLVQKNKSSKTETLQMPPSNSFGEKDKYAFEAADKLFDIFEDMNQDLIKRYKAISRYYSKVKNWQEESEDTLNQIEYDSPDFVINVIKKKPLLDYLDRNKSKFLENLPNLSDCFHKGYTPKLNNIDEVFKILKNSYLDNIYENTEDILDISIVDYIQGKEYPYFEPALSLKRTMNTIQNVSKPFCNLKQTANALDIQNYVAHEKLTNNEDVKLSEFSRHRDPAINPISTFRKNNRKKYVVIQVAAIDNVMDVVRWES
ncbi:MAG: C1 family peptidase [Psychroflexus sp.]